MNQDELIWTNRTSSRVCIDDAPLRDVVARTAAKLVEAEEDRVRFSAEENDGWAAAARRTRGGWASEQSVFERLESELPELGVRVVIRPYGSDD